MSRLALRLLATAALPALAGCGAACGQPPRPDVIADIAAHDVRDTMSPDHFISDAAVEADAPFDAPRSDGAWVQLDELPPECVVARAVDPPRVVPPLAWRACDDGRAGCEELRVEWGGPTPTRERLLTVLPGWHDGVRGWLVLHQRLDDRAVRTVVAPTRGEAVAAWRWTRDPTTTRNCGLIAPAIGPSRYAVVLLLGQIPWRYKWVVLRGPLVPTARDIVGPRVAVDADLGGAETYPQEGSVTDEIWAAGTQPGAWVVRAADAFEIVARTSSTNGYVGGQPSTVGSDVLYVARDVPAPDGGLVSALTLAPRGGTPAPLVTARDGTDVVGMRTDGRDLAWIVGVGRRSAFDFTRYELWTAPYTRVAAEVRPRVVGPVDSIFAAARGESAVGYGRFAFARVVDRMATGEVRVVNLADGSYWDLAPPPGTYLTTVLYLGPDEIALEVGALGDDVGTARTIVRQRFDALGPPHPAPPLERDR